MSALISSDTTVKLGSCWYSTAFEIIRKRNTVRPKLYAAEYILDISEMAEIFVIISKALNAKCKFHFRQLQEIF